MAHAQNEYSRLISERLYADTPKAVLAAIVVSQLLNHFETPDDGIDAAIVAEWATLHQNGILQQRPKGIR